ncbi:LysR family transcriptional regulator [Aquibacillus rhizosphaerae]|uniref:LysR family transcriptional regulator n=1 Tax=Aquibacillus rhizosphaerae TaxID=3051431 RepID=A0ABT7L5D1_9BACI|nr:LysR family transcriptional regulator [Aquibacillus sp. LR5S19]MDL4841073.1 LysR family transcriptional regulator [Aquibacillus sp. LR5S19]
MRIDDYQLLLAIRMGKTIRKAAEQLFISQPAVSQRLKSIEEQWDKQLFIRTHKQLIITPVGEKVLAFAEEMVKKEAELQDEITSISDKVIGKLSLGVSSMIGQYVLPKVLQAYMERYPEVTIKLETGLSNHIVKADYHVSIVRGRRVMDKQCVPLFADQLLLIDKKMEGNKLQRPLIEFQSDQEFHSMVNDWFIKQGDSKPPQIIKVDQIETCKQLMLHGIGMAVLPESAIADVDKDNYHITPLYVENQPMVRHTWLCYSEVAKQLPQVKAFIELVEKYLKES